MLCLSARITREDVISLKPMLTHPNLTHLVLDRFQFKDEEKTARLLLETMQSSPYVLEGASIWTSKPVSIGVGFVFANLSCFKTKSLSIYTGMFTERKIMRGWSESFLSSESCLEKIKLDHVTFTRLTFELFAKGIQYCDSLNSIELTYCDFSDFGLPILIEKLPVSKKYYLLVDGKGVKRQCLNAFVLALRRRAKKGGKFKDLILRDFFFEIVEQKLLFAVFKPELQRPWIFPRMTVSSYAL